MEDDVNGVDEEALAAYVGVGMIVVVMTVFVLEAFNRAEVNPEWIWPMLVTAGALILGVRRLFTIKR